MIAENAIVEAPENAIVVLVHVGRGEDAIPLIRLARDHKVRILCVDRWNRCLGYIKEHAPDCYGFFTLYSGDTLEAAKACRDESLETVVYLRGQPTAEEWAAWQAKTPSGRILALEAA